jgi:hypothetical protein
MKDRLFDAPGQHALLGRAAFYITRRKADALCCLSYLFRAAVYGADQFTQV